MRTLVDIPDEQLAELTRLAEQEKVSRASLVRRAVAEMLASKRKAKGDGIAAAFGLWANRDEDGLAYQERLRSEW
jgi:metal-responsive CopG/Arc/MetJ family transcriptional regulator